MGLFRALWSANSADLLNGLPGCRHKRDRGDVSAAPLTSHPGASSFQFPVSSLQSWLSPTLLYWHANNAGAHLHGSPGGDVSVGRNLSGYIHLSVYLAGEIAGAPLVYVNARFVRRLFQSAREMAGGTGIGSSAAIAQSDSRPALRPVGQ